MSSIDERIVDMKFNNGQFEQGVRKTLDLLAGLKKALNLDGAKKSLQDVEAAGKNFNLGNMGATIEGVNGKFLAMATVAVTALARITNSAITAGSSLVKSLTVDPIKSGLQEYETQLNSVQTILANTQSKGSTLKDVNAALGELNTYADKTIYNFSEMARNIGTFTAAGVDLDKSTSAIKGIANLAAVSGSNSQQATTAMYQLSQAMSTGTVKLMDWNSVVNAGMGGELFQTALKDTARQHGVAVDAIIKKNGSFRDSLQEGWLSADIMTETLSKMTGDLTDKQLKSMGYTDEQIKGIQEMAKTASDAATKVKTVSQLIGTLQESAQSGWAQTWQIVFGDFEEAKELFTEVNNVLGALIGESADARNKMMGDWKALGGRTAIIDAIRNSFNALMDVFKPIKEAFREIFPPMTGKQLADISKRIRDLTANFKMAEETTENLKRTFKGVFAILDIGKTILTGVFTALGTVVSEIASGTGGVLNFTASVGDFLVSLNEAIKASTGFSNFFKTLGTVLASPIRMLKSIGSAIGSLFSNFEGGDEAVALVDKFNKRLEPLKSIADRGRDAMDALSRALQRFFEFLRPFVDRVREAFGGLGEAIANSIKTGDFDKVLDVVNTGLLGGIVLLLKKFTSGGINVDLGGGLVDSIKETFGGLTDTLGAMQAQLKSGTLVKIAGAVALLAASVVALSLIDSAALTKALSAITVMFIQLLGVMAIMEKIASSKGALRMPFVTTGLLLLSGAILVLSTAVRSLSGLSWEELVKGLAGVTALLVGVAGAAQLMSGVQGKLVSAGVGMIAVAAAIKILASAVRDFSSMDWASMGKGLAGVSATLLALGIFSKLASANKVGLAQSAGLVLLAGALKILATVVGDFSDMSWGELGKGMAGMAAALALVAGAMALLPPTMIISAAGLVLVAGALVILQKALQAMGGMSWEEIGKGLVVLAGALVIIAAAMVPMLAALPGAAALIVITGALALLTPVLMALGGMSWSAIGTGLATLAAVFLTLGVAALALTPVIPSLLGLGVAIGLIGVGTLAAGAGLLAFSAGLTALGVAGAAGAAGLVAVVSGIVGLIPMAMTALGQGIVAFANVIAGAGPTFVAAMTTLMMSLLKAIDNIAPKLIDTLMNLISKLISTLTTNLPKFVDQGMKMITGILEGIASNIGGVVDAAVDIIVNFIGGISRNIPRIIQSAIDLVLAFINGLADGIDNNTEKVNAAVERLIKAMFNAFTSGIANVADIGGDIVSGIAKGISNGLSIVTNAAKDLASKALNAAKDFLGINSPSKEFQKLGKFSVQGFAQGLTGNKEEIQNAYASMKGMLHDAMKSGDEDIAAAKERLKKLTDARKQDTEAIKKATAALEQARAERKASGEAYTYLTKKLDDEKRALKGLAVEYDDVSNRLSAAQETLANAKKTRDDYEKSLTDQYSKLADITDQTTVGTYLTDMQKQIADTQEFANQLQTLKALGLSDEMYKQLLAKGPAALPFVNELVSGGKQSVDELNFLTDRLVKTSENLASNASAALYQAGVDAAQGLVKGLKAEQKNIDAQMDRIAKSMVKALRKRLKIKSPSRIFAELGAYSTEGLVVGLSSMQKEVAKASSDVGDTAIKSLGSSLSKINNVALTDVDLSPRIRPVLDLSSVRKEAGTLDGILAPGSLKVGASYEKAAQISSDNQIKQARVMEVGQTITNETNVQFVQTNNSPKALSPTEIYRNTKNLLSVAKRGMDT